MNDTDTHIQELLDDNNALRHENARLRKQLATEFNERQTDLYQEVRLNDDKTVDEFVANRVHVHMEQMTNTCWWFGIDRGVDAILHIDLWSKCKIHCLVRDEGFVTPGLYADYGRSSGGIVTPEPRTLAQLLADAKP